MFKKGDIVKRKVVSSNKEREEKGFLVKNDLEGTGAYFIGVSLVPEDLEMFRMFQTKDFQVVDHIPEEEYDDYEESLLSKALETGTVIDVMKFFNKMDSIKK